MIKSVLKPGKQHLIERKEMLLKLLESSSDSFVFVLRSGKRITRSRADVAREISEIDQEIKNQDDFEKKVENAVPLTHPMHFYWANRDTIEKILKKPKRSKAGKKSGEERAKKSAKLKSVFFNYYDEKKKKVKLDKQVSDASIIKSFTSRNKKAPQDPTTYYGYLKNR